MLNVFIVNINVLLQNFRFFEPEDLARKKARLKGAVITCFKISLWKALGADLRPKFRVFDIQTY